MKMFNSVGPNPRMVRMFLAEKGITVPLEEVNMLAGENRGATFKKKNPGGTVPALELDDGTVIGETVSICGYLEELHPTPALIGSTAQERAVAHTWIRRVEQNITENLYCGFRFAEGLPLFKERMRCMPEAAKDFKTKAQDGLQWLEELMEGKTYVCGERLTVADLVLYCAVDFAASAGQPLDPALKNLSAWFKRMDARPSAASTIAPNWKEIGMRV